MMDLEKIGKEMPYKVPEHFMEDVTDRVLARVAVEAPRKSVVWHSAKRYLLMTAAGAAAVVVLLLHPVNFNNQMIPDYESISQCENIDEVFGSMSASDLGLYSMMSNYYGE